MGVKVEFISLETENKEEWLECSYKGKNSNNGTLRGQADRLQKIGERERLAHCFVTKALILPHHKDPWAHISFPNTDSTLNSLKPNRNILAFSA